jgi:glycosyltransferase involved in cell wall biosynthesis
MLSIIICTYNREKYIYNALKSIATQAYPCSQYELIVINNNSTDKTEETCQKFEQDFPAVDFHYHIEYQQGLSYARNRGIKESKGDIIIYLDDDIELFPNFLEEYDNFFKQYPDAIGAGGRVIPRFEGEEPKWISKITRKLLGGALDLGSKIKPFKSGKYPIGCNSAYLSKAFKEFGLFNTELGRKGTGLVGSEEKDMYDRFRNNGRTFYYIPNAIVYHYIPISRFSDEYFKNLSFSIGVGEKIRTLSSSKGKYLYRLFQEIIKWCGTFVLLIAYTISLHPQKGWKLIVFRWYLTKGLIKK